MYRDRLVDLAAERARVGATARVSNDFMERVLTGLEPPR
jgi:hypothetical protein